jgi:hypothetical protein
VVDLDAKPAPSTDVLVLWARSHDVRVLNVAGPRETEAKEVGRRAGEWLEAALRARDRSTFLLGASER